VGITINSVTGLMTSHNTEGTAPNGTKYFAHDNSAMGRYWQDYESGSLGEDGALSGHGARFLMLFCRTRGDQDSRCYWLMLAPACVRFNNLPLDCQLSYRRRHKLYCNVEGEEIASSTNHELCRTLLNGLKARRLHQALTMISVAPY
jgi:hypothetical protein